MSRNFIKVLLIEDDEDDYILTQELFNEISGQKYQVDWVADFDTGIRAIQQNGYDVYLVDYRLGKENGLKLLTQASHKEFKTPFILLTGVDNRDLDLEAMEAGAADFLVKATLSADLLDRSIRYAIRHHKVIKQLKKQEEELKVKSMAIASAAMPIVFANLIGEITYVNDAYMKMWGYQSSQEVLGKNPVEFGNKEDKVEQIMKALMTEGRWVGHDTAKKKDGTPFEVFISSSLIKNEAGTPLCLLASFMDLSELKKREAELRREKELAQTYLNMAGSIILVIDREGIIQLANQMATEVSGFAESELVGKDWFDCCVPADAQEDRRKRFDAIMKGEEVPKDTNESLIATKKGDRRIIRWQNRIITDEENINGIIISGIDITEQRQMQEDLKRSKLQLQEYNTKLERIVTDRTRDLQESEAKLKMAQEISKVGYWEWDFTDGSIYWSDQMYRNFGLPIGTKITVDLFLKQVHPDDVEQLASATNQLKENWDPQPMNYRIFTPQKEIKHMYGFGQQHLQDNEGNIIRISGIVQDITQMKKLEDTLKEVEAKQREAQRLAKLGYWELDVKTQELKWSKELYEIFELDPGIPINQEQFLGLIYPEDRKKLQELEKEGIASGERMQYWYRINTRSSQLKYIQGYFEKKTINDQNAVKLFGVSQDVTIHKRAEQQLEYALKKERELSELKSRFVSMASHEFRTPLTSILGSTDLIEMHAQLGKVDKFPRHINRIRSSVENLTSILNDFLSLEKLESGKVQYHPKPVEMHDYMEQVLEEVNLLTHPQQKIRFVHHGENQVVIDCHLVKNIIINLVSNAIKYSPGDKDVDLITTKRDRTFSIEVTDRGIGIPQAEQKMLFSRFFRASNVTDIKGTGLGLTIVKRYLDIMKGEISFESKEGQGTTFRVEIPQEVNTTLSS